MKNKVGTHGFTLIELLVYSAMVAFVLLGIVLSLQYAYRFYREETVVPRVDRAGTDIVERIVRDIRTGEDIVLESSTFGTALGELTIAVPDGVNVIRKHFSVVNNAILYTEDAAAPEALTPADMYVSRFRLSHIITPESEAVRVELELTYSLSGATSTRSFTGLSILRRSYE